MEVQVSKWGNSLGLRLPRALAQQVGITEGQKVRIVAKGEQLIVEATTPRCRLEDLLANVTPERMRAAFQWDGDVGREAVDE